MKNLENYKKVWAKPAIKALEIKKDTFSGSKASQEATKPANKP